MKSSIFLYSPYQLDILLQVFSSNFENSKHTVHSAEIRLNTVCANEILLDAFFFFYENSFFGWKP